MNDLNIQTQSYTNQLERQYQIEKKIELARTNLLDTKFATQSPIRQQLKVRCDNSFRHEFSLVVLTPENWCVAFEENKIDLFLCESAWSGVDPVARP